MYQPLILHAISSFNRGGRERQLATICKYSDRSYISTRIICFNRASISYSEEYGITEDIIFLSSKNPLKRLLEIRRVVKETKAEIIWSWGGIEATYSMLISLISGIKHINGSVRHGIVRFNIHQMWRMMVLHMSRNVVANSRAGLRANRLKRGFVMYNGIDNKFFIKPEKKSFLIRKEFGLADNVTLLSSIGNLVPYKDYATVLKALSIVKTDGVQFHYIAIGEGQERERIEELIIRLNLSGNISFPGSRSDIREILYESDIFIHSSRGEGCSNAILEAMATGLPVIASDTGGTREFVNESNGRLFEFQNVEQLVEAILELIPNKSLRENLGENSTKKALNDFSVERMMSYYYEIIEEVLG